MQLEPRQFSALAEMGIPVWELRQQIVNASQAVSVGLNEQQLQADYLVLFDRENQTAQKQQLLTAIFLAIGINISTVAVIDPEQLQSLKTSPLANKTLLVFGLRIAQQLVTDINVSAPLQIIEESGLSVIATHSLTELMQSPEKKQDTWQSIKLALHIDNKGS